MSNQNIFALTRAGVVQIEGLMALGPADRETLAARVGSRETSKPSREGGGVIAVIPIMGMIEQRTTVWGAIFGGTSTQRLSELFRLAMGDPSVKAVVFDVSSGGGSVFGVTELANEIRAARGTKPVVSQVNSMACSAAYWLASQADEVVSAPSGITGSVGVYAIHQDYSGADEKAGIKTEIISAGDHKSDAVEGAPLSDEGRESMQALVNHIYGMFIDDLAAGRKVSASVVRSDFGKGLMMTAPAAKAAGMVDRVGTLDETLKRLSTQTGRDDVLRAGQQRAVAWNDGDGQRRLAIARATVASFGLVADDDGSAQRARIRSRAGL